MVMQGCYKPMQRAIRYSLGSFYDNVHKGKVKTPQSILKGLIDKSVDTEDAAINYEMIN